MDPKLQNLITISENTLARVHDEMIKNYIVESLLKNGKVDIEETQFFNEISKKIIHESSDLFIPSKEEILESMNTANFIEESAKVLVDPDTGDKFIYYPDTGELVPSTDEDDVDDMTDEDDVDDMTAEDDVDEENEDIDPASNIDEDDVDVSAAGNLRESKEENDLSDKKELNENTILVQNLMKLIKA